jgi:hypothetical protein
MIIKIKSENPHLLDILYKNPNTDFGVYARPLKRGVVIGHVVSPAQYDIVFQDTKYSYLPEDSNQIDFQSYCNPLVVMDICTDFFSHLLKSKKEAYQKELTWLHKNLGDLDTQTCSIEIPSFYIHSGWMRDDSFLLSKYFKGISVQHQSGYIYSLSIQAKSIFEAINLLSLTSLFTHITNDYGIYTYINESFADKYARILTNLDHVPYFVFYLFVKKAVRSESLFEVVKPVFESYLSHQGLTANLTWLPTHQARIKYITEYLDVQTPILDIGCGELLYFKKMMLRGFRQPYYAVDIDPRFETVANAIKNRYESSGLEFYTNLDQYKNNEMVNVIISEVIEHNTKEDAVALLRSILKFQYKSVIITTPNAEFNKYYSETMERRHEDHVFEPTRAEFKEIIHKSVGDESGLTIKFDHIGDSLNGVQPTQVCIITKN